MGYVCIEDMEISCRERLRREMEEVGVMGRDGGRGEGGMLM